MVTLMHNTSIKKTGILCVATKEQANFDRAFNMNANYELPGTV